MELKQQIESFLNKEIQNASSEELYDALLHLTMQLSNERPVTKKEKKLYYISAEFLCGKQLGKNLINLGIYAEVKKILEENGKDLIDVENYEQEPSLGNGGLGRLASCFLDSISTLGLSGDGIGLRYHFGLFKQEFINHEQHEVPDKWIYLIYMLLFLLYFLAKSNSQSDFFHFH